MSTEYLQEKKNRRKDFFGKIFAIVFIVWFIASIVGLYIFQGTLYCVMIFGQYFFIFGLIPLFASKGMEKFLAAPFILVGICCVAIPYGIMHPELIPKEVNWDFVIVILMLLGFLLAGVAMIVFPLYSRNKLKRVCNYAVTAKIIEYDTTISEKGNTLYCPIYGFWYNGQDRKVSSNTYTNFGVRDIGTECELLINPDNPEEFYDKNSKGHWIPVIMGICFVVFVLPILILVINNGLPS